MKKLSIFILAIFFMGTINSQEAIVTWDGLKKLKEKSDSEILNPKKSIKSKTWLKRADTYFNIYTFVTGSLYKGMAKEGKGINNAKYLVGEPGKVLNVDGKEVWVYARKKITFNNGVVESWEQTDFIDKDALKKSAKAILKAIELDEKGKIKEKATTKSQVQMIKNTVINQAITEYTEYTKNSAKNNNTLTDFGKNKLNKAYDLMSLGYELSALPTTAADTVFSKEQVRYFQGVIAYNNKKYDIAKKHFKESISNKYGEGSPYHYLAESYAKSGDSAKYISTVKEGFHAFPEEEQLIIDLINYYMIRKESNKAVEYIDMAISKNPKNPSYYSAKATIYDNRTDKALNDYKKVMDNAYELKKEAFRLRNNQSKASAVEKKRDLEVDKANNIVKSIKADLSKAEELYNKTLEIDNKNFNAAYNLGRLYLKHNERNALHADYLLKVYKNKDFAKSSVYEDEAKANLKTAANKFEIAHKLNPNDRDVLVTLKRIYYRLHDKTNRERVEKLIDNLTSTGSGIE